MNVKTTTTSTALTLGLMLTLLLPQTGQCFYNPSTGRWLSRDPISERGGPALYAFVENNSISRVDTLGLRGDNAVPSMAFSCPAKFCCCATSIKISGIGPNPSPTHWGNQFTATINMSFAIGNVEGACSFSWWEWAVAPGPNMTTKKWFDQASISPQKVGFLSTLNPWFAKTANQRTVTITDVPGLGLNRGESATQDLYIKIKVMSAPNCPCSSSVATKIVHQQAQTRNGAGEGSPTLTEIELLPDPPGQPPGDIL